MKNLVVLILMFNCQALLAQPTNSAIDSVILLPNGWKLSPYGTQVPLGDLPLHIAVSKNGKLAAVTNNGQSSQSIQLIDVARKKVVATIPIAKSWYGLAFSNNSKFLYASGGNDNRIMKYAVKQESLEVMDSIYLTTLKKALVSPAGFALDEVNKKIFVVTKEDSSLYILQEGNKSTPLQFKLPAEGYTCIFSTDKKILYISCWGAAKICRFVPATNSFLEPILVGTHPTDMVLNKKGTLLYVANAEDNSVSVIDTKNEKVSETLNAALFPNALPGSTTNAVALSKDEKTLYIANADNNCLSVFDVSVQGSAKSRGYIPTGWYPTSIAVLGKQILVTNGKGMTSLPNPAGPNPMNIKQAVHYQLADTGTRILNQYIGGLFTGTLSFIPEPSTTELSILSQKVYANTPYSKAKELLANGEKGNPIPMNVGDASPIKHIFYIIKENRTYDQVLGDVPGGNGDTSLVFFGKYYTPNQHKIVNDFVLLDNFYVDAEVSADGHNWSMGAHANDFLEKTWPTSYGGRGGGYYAEGLREIANNKNGFIWDHCKRNGISYRSYGEFGSNATANIKALEGKMCAGFTGWDMKTPDTTRYSQWVQDFDSLVAINQVPQLSTLRFGNDHTEGMKKGALTPYAHVGDNDYAVGLFLEHLSASPIWKESLVLIVEDDAQNGADHVDAHRSTGYLVGPYVKRNFIDHSMYSTSSFLRTIELVLGMPPMTQYDAAASSLWRSFTSVPDFTSYKVLMPKVDLSARNTTASAWQESSEKFNFAKEDGVPDREFNEVLWYGLKGTGRAFPAPTRMGFLNVSKSSGDKDD